ncbi:MAG: class A beta-lactamase [Candidatus Eremiobacteraeota bacterium]|nr:class A beta-lactamase [Candidatus Eremiobacteraeota bacterium]
MRRSSFVVGTTAVISALGMPIPTLAAADPTAAIEKIEAETQGRLGVVIADTGSRKTIAYRADERFPMCSTFKVLAVSAILSNVDRGTENLDRHVSYSNADLLDYAPVTRTHVREGSMTLRALCEAAIQYSDNTAANLLLKVLGGPQAVTEFARAHGDATTILSRTEPTLNTAIPGDTRDTTTPSAMAKDLQMLVLGAALKPASRRELTNWMVECRTGDACLRAGIPRSWIIGDKTGSGGRENALGDRDTRNDIAIVWPPARAPLVIATYLTGSKVSSDRSDAALASIGRIATSFA